MLDFGFATYSEISKEMGARLRKQRLSQLLTQEIVAERAGVSVGTVKNLEKKGQASLESLVRIVIALGLTDDLQPIFELQVKSIAQMKRAELAIRQRAPRQNR